MNREDTLNFLNNELANLATELSEVTIAEQKSIKQADLTKVKTLRVEIKSENIELKNQIKNKVK